MLPNEYIYASSLDLTSENYINTGIVPTSDCKMEILLEAQTGQYAFGARNTNSNTSQGQYNLYTVQGGTSYFGYHNTRINLGNILLNRTGSMHVNTNKNAIELIQANAIIIDTTGATTTFTGTRPIYIGGLNNGGTLMTGRCVFMGLRRYDLNGNLTHNLIPCRRANDLTYGVYDDVAKEFIIVDGGWHSPTLYVATIEQTVGGTGFIKTVYGQRVTKACGGNNGHGLGYNKITLDVETDVGYEFLNWTINDVVVSTNKEFEYGLTSNVTIKPNFIKKATENIYMGFQSMAVTYGASKTRGASPQDNIYAKVLSASVNASIVEKAVTTIVLEETPSSYIANMPMFIISPRGKVVYQGIIKSVVGNTVTCEEPLSIFDQEYLFTNNNNIDGIDATKYSILYTVSQIMRLARNTLNYSNDTSGISNITVRKFTNIIPTFNENVGLNKSSVFSSKTPAITEVSVLNLEDYFRDLFNQYGVYVKSELKLWKDVQGSDLAVLSPYKSVLTLQPSYIREKEPIVISDNVEVISDTSITLEDTEYTWLVVYNSAGTSVRGIYGMTKDGNVEAYGNESDENFLAYSNYKVKVINSGDDIKQLVEQYLSNAQYNHKITFNLSLDGSMFDIDTLELGRRVNFYYENRMYESVITALEYEIAENNDKINTVKITMGKVRNSLTSKINLGKVK